MFFKGNFYQKSNYNVQIGDSCSKTSNLMLFYFGDDLRSLLFLEYFERKNTYLANKNFILFVYLPDNKQTTQQFALFVIIISKLSKILNNNNALIFYLRYMKISAIITLR